MGAALQSVCSLSSSLHIVVYSSDIAGLTLEELDLRRQDTWGRAILYVASDENGEFYVENLGGLGALRIWHRGEFKKLEEARTLIMKQGTSRTFYIKAEKETVTILSQRFFTKVQIGLLFVAFVGLVSLIGYAPAFSCILGC